MRSRGLNTCLALAVLATVAACKSAPADRPGTAPTARARYLPYLGSPVGSFPWMMRLDGWEALSDSELVIFMDADSAYYLKVGSPCGLRSARILGLTSSVGGTVIAGLDSVRTVGLNCPIAEIRPLDSQRLRADAGGPRPVLQTAAAEPASLPPPEVPPTPHPQ